MYHGCILYCRLRRVFFAPGNVSKHTCTKFPSHQQCARRHKEKFVDRLVTHPQSKAWTIYILYLAGFRKAKYNYIMDIGSLDYRGAVPATQTSHKNIAQIFQLNQPLLAEAPHYQPCVFAWKSHTDRQLSPWFWNTHSPPLPAAWQQACRGQLLSISCMLNCKHGVALCARVVRYPLHICLVLFFSLGTRRRCSYRSRHSSWTQCCVPAICKFGLVCFNCSCLCCLFILFGFPFPVLFLTLGTLSSLGM